MLEKYQRAQVDYLDILKNIIVCRHQNFSSFQENENLTRNVFFIEHLQNRYFTFQIYLLLDFTFFENKIFWTNVLDEFKSFDEDYHRRSW